MPKKTKAAEFVLSFIAASDRYRRQYFERWEEVLANFMVDPRWALDSRASESPYRQGRIWRSKRNRIILKDPETHKLVMSLASKIVQAVFGDPRREYIRAQPVGYEDVEAAKSVSRLERYAFHLPGHFRTLVESVVDMLLFGTAPLEIGWDFEEREMPVRTVRQLAGVEIDEIDYQLVTTYDDVKIRNIDIVDFYPDPSRYLPQDMLGAAKRFRVSPSEARRKANSGLWDSAAVERAIHRSASQTGPTQTSPQTAWIDQIRKGIDQPEPGSESSQFGDIIGYEYYGELDHEDDRDGTRRRVVTLLGDEEVRNARYPYADAHLPFHALIINPIKGRYYGIAPAEIIRWDQSFADAVKILLAEAIVRQVHPPIAYDPDADTDLSKIREWRADLMIPVRGGPGSIGTLRYDANIAAGTGLLQGLKSEIQTGSGAPGSIQGQPGPDRESASVGLRRLEFAMERPELAAMVLENESLPAIGRSILARYQQFLDTDGLRERIGDRPEGMWIGQIMGQFDIRFVGSRMSLTRQQKLQSVQALTTMAASVPQFAARVPWHELGEWLIGELLELPEIAAKMSDIDQMQVNQLLAQVAGNQPGSPPALAEPPGILPQQAAGGVS